MQYPISRRRSLPCRAAAVLSVLWVLWAPAALAQEPGPLGSGADLSGCDSDTAARLRFVEGELDGDASYARWWQRGWLAIYVGGMGWGGLRAGLADGDGERARYIATSIKSMIGLARGLWAPPRARLGSSEVADLPADSASACAARLALAEEILRDNARATDEERWGWKGHLGNAVLNWGTAAIVSEAFGKSPGGWIDGAVGWTIGEVRLWSFPWQAQGALAEYERRFPASGLPAEPQARWGLAPWGAGARLTVEF